MRILSAMPSINHPCHVYLDLDVLNNDFSSGAKPHRLEFQETRNSPFLDGDSSNYFCSIVRFSIQTGSSLPVFIPRIADPTVDIDETIYKVTLNYGTRVSTVAVKYNPGSTTYRLLKKGGNVNTALGSDYYHVKNYQDFIEMVNLALSTAFTNLSVQLPANTFAATTAPYLEFDPSTNKCILNSEINFFKQDQSTPVEIYFNSRLYELFVGFRSDFISYDGDKNHKLIVIDTRGINYKLIKLANGTTYTFIQMYQEISSVPLWNPVASIVFCSSMLPVVPTQTSKPNIISNNSNNFTSGGDNSNLANMLSDFEIAIDAVNQYRPFILYAPSAEYRLIDLYSGTDLNRLNIQVFWKDHFGNLNPLYIPPGASAHMKLMFRRKDFNISDY